jgi:hypothetical protein
MNYRVFQFAFHLANNALHCLKKVHPTFRLCSLDHYLLKKEYSASNEI